MNLFVSWHLVLGTKVLGTFSVSFLGDRFIISKRTRLFAQLMSSTGGPYSGLATIRPESTYYDAYLKVGMSSFQERLGSLVHEPKLMTDKILTADPVFPGGCFGRAFLSSVGQQWNFTGSMQLYCAWCLVWRCAHTHRRPQTPSLQPPRMLLGAKQLLRWRLMDTARPKNQRGHCLIGVRMRSKAESARSRVLGRAVPPTPDLAASHSRICPCW